MMEDTSESPSPIEEKFTSSTSQDSLQLLFSQTLGEIIECHTEMASRMTVEARTLESWQEDLLKRKDVFTKDIKVDPSSFEKLVSALQVLGSVLEQLEVTTALFIDAYGENAEVTSDIPLFTLNEAIGRITSVGPDKTGMGYIAKGYFFGGEKIEIRSDDD